LCWELLTEESSGRYAQPGEPGLVKNAGRGWLVSTRIKRRSTSLADPKEFAHIRRELGIDPTNHETAVGCAETSSLEIT
jgi:hypothetical protein